MTANYPRDCWYVAATTDEIGVKPLSRRMLDRQVVLYRQPSGQIVALADQCGHCGYPLSRGKVDGANITCGYHGLVYDPTGTCIAVPSQPHPPYGARVASYPTRETGPFVWIWLGERRRADERTVPDLPWLTEPGWASTRTRLHVDANYMFVHEHYLDLTHIPWVHPRETPPTMNAVASLDSIEVSERSVTFSRELPVAPPAPWETVSTGLSADRSYRRRHYGTFISPAVLAEGWDVFADDGNTFGHLRIQAVTPESPTSSHLFWHFCRNYGLDDQHVARHLHAVFEKVMRVDVGILETIEASVGYRGTRRAFNVTADAGILKARRIIESMLMREHTYRSLTPAPVVHS